MHRATIALGALLASCGHGSAGISEGREGAGRAPQERSLADEEPGASRLRVLACAAITHTVEGAWDAWEQAGHPRPDICIAGEDTGLVNLAKGDADLMLTSAPPRPRDLRRGLEFVAIGHRQLALAVHPSNPIEHIQRKDMVRLLRGQAGTWEQLDPEGWGDEPRRIALRGVRRGRGETIRDALGIPTTERFPTASRHRSLQGVLNQLRSDPAAFALCDRALAAQSGLKTVPILEESAAGPVPNDQLLRYPVYGVIHLDAGKVTRELLDYLAGNSWREGATPTQLSPEDPSGHPPAAPGHGGGPPAGRAVGGGRGR